MGEVRYSINGKYFKDYNVFISSSDGIGDGLKRKKVNTYDWPEYHGESPDLSNPKFEAREITLKGFVIGSNWDEMMENFNTVIYEFQKPGTQRLLIEPFNMKVRPYEVYMEDSTPLEKTFKDGQMVGVFTLKLIEPNPIKKVLYLTDNTLNLSYNSSKETEIFFVNGEKTTAKGNVSLSGKTLANRVVSGYAFGGRNFLRNSKNFAGLTNWNINNNPVITQNADYITLDLPANTNSTGIYQPLDLGGYIGDITISFDALSAHDGWNADLNIGIEGKAEKTGFGINDVQTWTRFSFTLNLATATNSCAFIFYKGNNANPLGIHLRNIKLEKGNKATDWTPAPEDEKYIIIAGDIDGITNLTTNAQVLWEKL